MLLGAGADPRPVPGPAAPRRATVRESVRRLRVRHRLVRAAVRRVPVQAAAARGGHFPNRPRHQADPGQHPGIARRQGHSDDVLVVPGRRSTRFRQIADASRAPAEEEAGAESITSRATVAIGRIGLLNEFTIMNWSK